MESRPDTLTDIAQECTQNVQRITSEDTEITQVHTIFLLFVSLYKTNVNNYNWGRTMHLAILHMLRIIKQTRAKVLFNRKIKNILQRT